MFSCFSYLEQLCYNLLRAVETGDVGAVGRLLSLGVSPDFCISDIINRHSLHVAAIKNSTEIARLLITHKANIEARDKYNQTPLFVTAIYNSTEVVQLLIAHKADIEARDKDNLTPLDVARNSSKNTESVIGLLMKHTANPSWT